MLEGLRQARFTGSEKPAAVSTRETFNRPLCSWYHESSRAKVAELADAPDLGTCTRHYDGVRQSAISQ